MDELRELCREDERDDDADYDVIRAAGGATPAASLPDIPEAMSLPPETAEAAIAASAPSGLATASVAEAPPPAAPAAASAPAPAAACGAPPFRYILGGTRILHFTGEMKLHALNHALDSQPACPVRLKGDRKKFVDPPEFPWLVRCRHPECQSKFGDELER